MSAFVYDKANRWWDQVDEESGGRFFNERVVESGPKLGLVPPRMKSWVVHRREIRPMRDPVAESVEARMKAFGEGRPL